MSTSGPRIPIFWAIAFLLPIALFGVVLGSSDRPKPHTVNPPSISAEDVIKRQAPTPQRAADEKCFTAVYNYQQSLRIETKRKRLLVTSQIPGTDRYIAKFRLTSKLGLQSVVECTIANPLSETSRPEIIVY